MPPDSAEIEAFFSEKQLQVSHHTYPFEHRSIHYVSIGDPSLPTLLFIHGSPGHWSDFKDFLSDEGLLKKVHMLAVDRPGYGQSTGGVELELRKQAAAIAPILQTNQSGKPILLVGHSFGGGVIARLAMDNPSEIGGLIFAAPTLAPELEEIMLIQHIGNFPLFRFLIADWLDVCNQEMQPLAAELEKTKPLWKNITMPVTMIHGDADWIVPVGNIDYIEDMLPHNMPEVIRYDTMNHFIPWEQPDLIHSSILKHVEML